MQQAQNITRGAVRVRQYLRRARCGRSRQCGVQPRQYAAAFGGHKHWNQIVHCEHKRQRGAQRWRPIWNVHRTGAKALGRAWKQKLLKQQLAHIAAAAAGIVQLDTIRQRRQLAERSGRNYMQVKPGCSRRQMSQQPVQVLARAGVSWLQKPAVDCKPHCAGCLSGCRMRGSSPASRIRRTLLLHCPRLPTTDLHQIAPVADRYCRAQGCKLK